MVNEMKPRIAILPLIDADRNSYWMLPGYMEGILGAGGFPIMLPLTNESDNLDAIVDEYDGFLYPGGQDVSPALYGAAPSAQCGEISPKLDEMSQSLFTRIIQSGKPVLGICRGIQIINVMLGGTLYQDLPSEHPSEVEHHMTPPYDRVVHEVDIVKDSPLYELLGQERIGVNSYHHQAVKELSERLKVMAVSEDGLVEAVWMPDQNFVWAFQWHPELSFQRDENSKKIFRAFVDAAGDHLCNSKE